MVHIPNNYNSMAIELPVTFFGDGYIYYVILLKVGNVTLKDWESLTVRNGITWYITRSAPSPVINGG